MGMSDAKVANHTFRTAELLEKVLAELQRTNQLLQQLVSSQQQAQVPR